MARRGRPKGSQTETEWRDAIRLAVHERQGDQRKLRLLANRLVDAGLAGDTIALREIGDRLDGKPKQTIDAKVETTRYVVEVPASLPTDEWEKRFQPVTH